MGPFFNTAKRLLLVSGLLSISVLALPSPASPVDVLQQRREHGAPPFIADGDLDKRGRSNLFVPEPVPKTTAVADKTPKVHDRDVVDPTPTPITCRNAPGEHLDKRCERGTSWKKRVPAPTPEASAPVQELEKRRMPATDRKRAPEPTQGPSFPNEILHERDIDGPRNPCMTGPHWKRGESGDVEKRCFQRTEVWKRVPEPSAPPASPAEEMDKRAADLDPRATRPYMTLAPEPTLESVLDPEEVAKRADLGLKASRTYMTMSTAAKRSIKAPDMTRENMKRDPEPTPHVGPADDRNPCMTGSHWKRCATPENMRREPQPTALAATPELHQLERRGRSALRPLPTTVPAPDKNDVAVAPIEVADTTPAIQARKTMWHTFAKRDPIPNWQPQPSSLKVVVRDSLLDPTPEALPILPLPSHHDDKDPGATRSEMKRAPEPTPASDVD